MAARPTLTSGPLLRATGSSEAPPALRVFGFFFFSKQAESSPRGTHRALRHERSCPEPCANSGRPRLTPAVSRHGAGSAPPPHGSVWVEASPDPRSRSTDHF